MSALIRPPQFTLFLHDTVKLLRDLARTKNLDLGKVVHARLIVSNQSIGDNVPEMTSLVNLYSKCADMESARQVFDKMSQRNVVSWTALLAGFFQNGMDFEVLRLFKSMVFQETDFCPPNEYTFATVLSSCSNIGDLSSGRQCHGYVLKSGLVFHQYVKNALLRLYSALSDVAGAMEVMVSVPGLDTCSYNLILSGLIDNNYLTEASDVLRRMSAEQLAWNKATYICSFGLCARLKDISLGHQIHNQLLTSGVDLDAFVCSALIDLYGKCEDISSARKVFDSCQNRNVVSWTTMLSAYSQHRFFEESLKLFSNMQCDEFGPDESTFSVVLSSSAGLSSLGYGCSLHALAERYGFTDHKNVGNSLINMYSKTGDIEAANKVFLNMTNRDITTWNAVIWGYSHHGLGNKSLALFQEMLKTTNEHPNHMTFSGVLNACGHVGNIKLGFYFFYNLMKQNGIEPDLKHYTCMVGLLSKAGRLNEAKEFMISTPIKWDVIAWRTLLNACNIHRNYTLGTEIGNIILNLDPKDAGTYTLLSNIHAKANKWGGVTEIRELMKKRRVKKEPGLSWLEIKSQTHVFVSEYNGHPEFVEIHEKLKELVGKIKSFGYMPDTCNVFHDVEDEQKEDYVGYHSEKLAVAYAILRTGEGAPIRIIKNLRICDDCHLFMKLISAVTNRVINVRDANRFHCFRDGSCSCEDYW